MKKRYFRPAVILLAVAASFSAIYLGTWKYDPARLEKRALAGQAEAQYRLGKAYFSGYLVRKNYRTSAMWLAKAAAQSHLRAQTGLALMYAKGLGVRQDLPEAARLYREAAEQGSAEAQNQLGVLYAQGQGVPRDLNEAVKYFSRAAEQGCKTARQNLGIALAARAGNRFPVSVKGKVYSATVVSIGMDTLTVAFEPKVGALGLATIRFSDLPAELRQRYGFRSSRQPLAEAGLTRLSSLPPM